MGWCARVIRTMQNGARLHEVLAWPLREQCRSTTRHDGHHSVGANTASVVTSPVHLVDVGQEGHVPAG